ncbi:hypothetical protein LUZ60_012521 [Juncus effusus]|nr:hypothetical protein LUZ60_012521 [Juncus effusus]
MFNLFTNRHYIVRSGSGSDYYSCCCGVIITLLSITIFFTLLFILNVVKAFFITGAFILLSLVISFLSQMSCQTEEEPIRDSHLIAEPAHQNSVTNYILASNIPVLISEASVSLSCSTCSICLEAIKGGEKVKELPVCKHLFHVKCIDMWLFSHLTCPFCRSDIQPSVKPLTESPTASDQLPV